MLTQSEYWELRKLIFRARIREQIAYWDSVALLETVRKMHFGSD